MSHIGSTVGYRAFLARYPEQKVAIALLSNFGGANPSELGHKVIDLILAGAVKDKPKPSPIKMTEEELRAKAGLYRDLKTDAVIRLTLKEGKLILGEGRGRELVPIEPGRFLIEGGSEYFFEGGAKKPLVIRQTAEGYPPSFYTRVEPAMPTAQKLAEYEGKYWSEELEVFYIVAIKDGKLTIRHRPEPAAALEPTYEDGFLVGGSSGGTVIRFTRDKRGHVDGLSAYSGRVRHLRFFRK